MKIFYERQLQVLFEKRGRAGPYLTQDFFHWITARALEELVAEGKIKSVTVPLNEPVTTAAVTGTELLEAGGTKIRFFWPKRARYVTREAEAIRKLVLEFSHTEFGRALGHQAETMFDAALPRKGFVPTGWNVRAYGGREWTETGHDLDRVFERDGTAYGVEIKNTLDYIDRDELEINLRLCAHLGLTPLFIMRWAPKSYNKMIIDAGGFALLFEYQLYPHGQETFAKRVRETLGLPVDSPAAIADGTVQRFLRWHEEQLESTDGA
jgi:hypothetical protein